MNFWITTVIVIITYLGIAAGFIPKLKANRTTIALMGVGLLLVTGQIAFDDIGGYLDLDTLILLFSMMIINANLRIAGFFQLAAISILRLAKTPRLLLLVEIILTGILSAFLLNDTICLIFSPFLIELTLALRVNPIPYLIALATAANIGSTATLTGNPQNMIIGVASGISYTEFALALTPVALLGMVSIWFVLVKFYPYDFPRRPFAIAPEKQVAVDHSLLIKSLVVTGGLLVAFVVGVPVAQAAFLAACVLLITRRLHPEQVFAEFDWSLLVFFSALFILTGSLETNGITDQLASLTTALGEPNALNTSFIAVVLSNLISNVPAVLLLKSIVAGMTNPQAGWLTLAAASTLAGNLTLLGSVANLIVAEIASRFRIHLSFWEYTKAGLIITLLSLITGIAWLQFFIWR